MSDDLQWETNDGRKLFLRDMTTEHCRNAAAHLRKAIQLGRHKCDGHECQSVSFGLETLEGCYECHEESETLANWQYWIHKFDTEVARRGQV